MNQRNKPVVIEQIFHASTGKVWNAITRLEEMKIWFFHNIPSFEPVVGFETEFNVQSESRNFQHLWKILEAEPNKKIRFHWRYRDIKGEGFVTFELFESNKQTTLRVTNEGLETFPQDIPEFTRESCQAGWEFFIKKNLKAYLEGE
jgi:uncharacterized protein YndB with AHSA1/START domain